MKYGSIFRALAVTLGAVLAAACADQPTVPRFNPATIRLNFSSANQVANTAAVDIRVAYERTAGGNKEFFTTRSSVTSGEQQVSVAVNLAECLADPTHVGAAGACTVHVTVTLLDAANAVLDRQLIGPLVTQPGATATPSAVSLYTPTQPLAVGSNYACSISVGVTYCWGSNGVAQLGDGTISTRFTPVVVTGGYRFVALAAGFQSSCGLTGDGVIACWGMNLLGEVGDGTLARNKSTPGPVVGGIKFKSVFGGTAYMCALSTAGAAYCWGNNFYGHLGDGTTTDRLVPTPVNPTVQFTSLAPGMTHTCGLTAAGAAYCWGDNTFGAVGDGTKTNRLTPTAVTGGLTFASIASGSEQSCGLTSAGVAYCWGKNDSGELGDGTSISRSVPTLVAGGHTFKKIVGAHNGNGEDTTCGLATDGTLYCWGSNRVGQIGDGTLINRSVPTAVGGSLRFTTLDLDNGGGCALAAPGKPYCWGRTQLSTVGWNKSVPVPVTGLQNVVAMSSGTLHSCALVTGGAASCWGDNTLNSLGTATSDPVSVPTPVTGGLSFSAISIGNTVACALALNGAAYCWGANTNGTLGNGTSAGSIATPGLVSGGRTFVSIGVVSSSQTTAVPGHACGLTSAGAAFCWGLNSSGQLGDGTTTIRTAPTAVIGGLTFKSLTVGGLSTCGLTVTGVAFCWGANLNGEPGSSTPTTVNPAPVAIAGALTFTTMTTGGNHSCALTAAGAAYCWGRGANGQLGGGAPTTSPTPSPVAVTGGLAFAKIAAGAAHTCAVTAAGLAYCWGGNAAGALGDGTVTDQSSPVPVAGGRIFVGLAPGADHTCGWTAAGTAFCWGSSLRGQIGDGSGYSMVPVLIPIP